MQIKPLLALILGTIADATENDPLLKGIPSGHLYAHLMSAISLDTYNHCIAALKDAKLVSEFNHVLSYCGPALTPAKAEVTK